ncbi:MAG: DUF4956 domain-containing protein [Bacteroidota bacterium]
MEDSLIFTGYFFLRLLINVVSMIFLVRIVYYNSYKKRDWFFAFFVLNFIVFLLSYILFKTGSISTYGGAFALLAAFSLLRFRTVTISITDMSYLFTTMTIGLINSIMSGSYIEIIAVNVLIIGAVFVVDGNILIRNQKSKTIDYPSLENIRPDKHAKLIEELREFTGLDIQKITIEHLDVRRGKALIRMYYY